ncbi:MAG: energy transducer TonB [Acidobacteriia bacterium]|nr:energy transducer TonB [Terriglobia bacterium]
MLLSRGSLPGRGVLYSFLAHEIWLFGILFLSFLPGTARVRHSTEDVEMIDLRKQHEVIYLPRLGGGRAGREQKRSGAGSAAMVFPGEVARSSKGFTYPGPQPMVSDPPHPTNQIQTILQPALSKPRILKSFVPLPNMVEVASAPLPAELATLKLDAQLPDQAMPVRPALQWEKRQAARAIQPAVRRPRKVLIEEPKLTLPVSELQTTLLAAGARPKAPRREITANLSKPRQVQRRTAVEESQVNLPVSELQPSLPALSPQAKLPVAETVDPLSKPRQMQRKSLSATNGKEARDLLTLSPVPLPPDQVMAIPLGEARGRFAISPGPPAPAQEREPGAGGVGPSSAGVGKESASGVVPVNAAGGSGSSGKGMGGNGARGAGGGEGSLRGVGRGAGGGTGGGTGIGKGAGSGGIGKGAGRGAGDGHGSGSFSGITIQGGSLEGGSAGQSNAHQGTAVAPPTSYSLTIVSTASSGGGLGDYGVFANEQVYTVYIDVRRTLESMTPSWTLQCAVLRGAGAITIEGQETGANQQGFVPPIPITKELPELPAELVQDHLRELVVIYGVIDTAGKLKQLTVKQSPDGQLSRGLLRALDKWLFRPAELNGRPVPVKVLLGIPLAL